MDSHAPNLIGSESRTPFVNVQLDGFAVDFGRRVFGIPDPVSAFGHVVSDALGCIIWLGVANFIPVSH
jgi:hypothetical protein